MKKLIISIAIILTIFTSCLYGINSSHFFTKLDKKLPQNDIICTNSTPQNDSKGYYAKVQLDGVYFYTSPIEATQFRLFKIPVSYFVYLTSIANDTFYSCTYGEKSGYVKKTDVVAMKGVPQTPFACSFASFRLWQENGSDLRSSPKKLDDNIIKSFSSTQENLIFYGSIEGTELVPRKSRIWYYCKVADGSGEFGYLNESVCDELTEIPTNDYFDPETSQLFPDLLPSGKKAGQMSGTSKALIVVGVSLPCVILLYLLAKPTIISEKKRKNGQKTKEKRQKRRNDYFEFDENDLT